MYVSYVTYVHIRMLHHCMSWHMASHCFASPAASGGLRAAAASGVEAGLGPAAPASAGSVRELVLSFCGIPDTGLLVTTYKWKAPYNYCRYSRCSRCSRYYAYFLHFRHFGWVCTHAHTQARMHAHPYQHLYKHGSRNASILYLYFLRHSLFNGYYAVRQQLILHTHIPMHTCHITAGITRTHGLDYTVYTLRFKTNMISLYM